MSTPVVIYVAGYGRIGSTLLDVLLGNHPDVVSLGEFGSLWDFLAMPGFPCTCGTTLAECPFWRAVLDGAGTSLDRAGASREARAVEPIGSIASFIRRDVERYGWTQRALFESAADAGRATHLVDSSKTAYRFAWRPLALARLAGLDVHLIHLVRDPAQVLQSAMKGRNDQLAKGPSAPRRGETLITLAGWNVANVAALVNGWLLGRERYLRLRFDELVRDPETTLERVCRFLGLDPTVPRELVARRTPLAVGHLAGGNRMALRGSVVISPQEGDSATTLTRIQRFHVRLVSGWFYRILGGGARAEGGQRD